MTDYDDDDDDDDDVKPVKADSAGDRPSCETSHPKLVLDLAVERLLQFDEDDEILMRRMRMMMMLSQV